MMQRTYEFTSESVAAGHPDKVCDRISDEVVDLFLAEDPKARVACEVLATTNRVVISGEVRGAEAITEERVRQRVRETIRALGYTHRGFNAEAEITYLLHEQSPDIGTKVDTGGAGDQGLMFGYATDETEELMPAPLVYAHRILKLLADARKGPKLAGVLGPDAKSQVTLRYVDGKPVGVTRLVLSTQHFDRKLSSEDVREFVRPIVAAALPEGFMPPDDDFFVNPTGAFTTGGPEADTGLTGRKIIVDTYGGAAPHGGGAFSGKDPTKVDRSAAYAMRYLAKNVVAAGLARKATLQVAYAIGEEKPLSFYADLHGTGTVDEEKLANVLKQQLNGLTPRGIIDGLGLEKPIYARTAAYGHFGRPPEDDGGFSWEKTDLAEKLKKLF
ncbi:MAG: methionine adenosyltransferase [Methylobacteriaceae bacterium]|jgi:S-adenosylmethionine synthetase|nr:methionine adenosyltransferase [Methylobacteriaceae bacterium]